MRYAEPVSQGAVEELEDLMNIRGAPAPLIMYPPQKFLDLLVGRVHLVFLVFLRVFGEVAEVVHGGDRPLLLVDAAEQRLESVGARHFENTPQ